MSLILHGSLQRLFLTLFIGFRAVEIGQSCPFGLGALALLVIVLYMISKHCNANVRLVECIEVSVCVCVLTCILSSDVPGAVLSSKLMLYSVWLNIGLLSFSLNRSMKTRAKPTCSATDSLAYSWVEITIIENITIKNSSLASIINVSIVLLIR